MDPGSVVDIGRSASQPQTTPARTPLDVVAAYLLSEAGRKASLQAGGNGRAVQEVTIPVSRSRLHLVSVDARGIARLKLRPWFALDADRQRVVQLDASPEYDALPSAEELVADAARNHELAQRFHDERSTAALQRESSERAIKSQLAKEFLADAARRAIPYPAPTRRQCLLQMEGSRRRVAFDVSTDSGQLAEVPPEAHRRFRADLEARRALAKRRQTEQQDLHERKVAQVAEWIAAHGMPDQQARQILGVLPLDEAIEAMTSRLLATLDEFPRYPRDGLALLQAALAQSREYATTSVSRRQLVVTTTDASRVTKAQWEYVEAIRAMAPSDFTVTLRSHRISLRDAPRAPTVTVFGVLVIGRFDLITLRREYAVRA